MKQKKELRIHPALIFLLLTILVMVISSVGNILNIETSYYSVNVRTGDLENHVVHINSLFNRSGIQYLISNMVSNFITFAPLGNLIVGLLGVGVAYKSGFLNSLFKMIADSRIPRKLITFIIVLLGIISSMFFEVGYVILIPLSAILFKNLGRHPSAGICAAFAGVTFGYGANIIMNGLDSTLLEYTRMATSVLDQTYTINSSGNLFFMIVSTLLLAYLGTYITERFIILKLGKYTFTEEDEIKETITTKEKKGVIIAILAVIFILLILAYCLIPGLPFSGLLLDLSASGYVNQLFGTGSYFSQGVVFISGCLLVLAGLVYGLRVKTIRSNRDLVDGMNYYLKDISSILVLIFFAAQFCMIFRETNIGVFLVATFTELLSNLNLTGLLLVIVTFIIVVISSFFVPAASTKWAIMAPIVVPMFMQSSLSPEFAQAVFRAGDSAVKGISPLFTYFVILIGFLQIYANNKKKTVTITDAMSLMVPYTIGFSLLWLLIVIGFYIIGIPIGPGVGVML